MKANAPKATKIEVPQPDAKKAKATLEKAEKKLRQFQAAIKVLANRQGYA